MAIRLDFIALKVAIYPTSDFFGIIKRYSNKNRGDKLVPKKEKNNAQQGIAFFWLVLL